MSFQKPEFSWPVERGPQDPSSAGCWEPLQGQGVPGTPSLLHSGFCCLSCAADWQWTVGHSLKEKKDTVLCANKNRWKISEIPLATDPFKECGDSEPRTSQLSACFVRWFCLEPEALSEKLLPTTSLETACVAAPHWQLHSSDCPPHGLLRLPQALPSFQAYSHTEPEAPTASGIESSPDSCVQDSRKKPHPGR